MKQYSKKLFSVALLLSTAATDAVVSPFLQWRSQGRNTARKLVGTTTYAVDQYDMEKCYGTFNATLEYDRSFKPQYISQALFGCDLISAPATTNSNGCSNSCGGRAILIQGLNPNGQGPSAINAKSWMAENFFLPDEFQSTISMKPLVQNVLVDFDWYMGMDRWAKGLFFRLYGPVVNNRTSLKAKENIITPAPADAAYEEGFVATTTAEGSLFTSALQFFEGQQLPQPITGITFMPLAFAKFNGCGHKSKTGFAELRGELGWNYIQENYRVGFDIQAAAPTGTRPHAEWVLEPQIGNGKHWELGGGLKALWTMWRSEDEEKRFDFVFEADITHLFKAKQTRTFDLVGKPNSRYMLAEKLQSNANEVNHLDGNSNAGFEFAGVYSPVANFSTRDVKVSIGAQGDLVAMFTYTMRGLTWDLGYNFWGMSHEKISSNSCGSASSSNGCYATVPFAENTWALKGDASVFGTTTAGTVIGVSIPLAATESGATIHAGTNAAAAGPTGNPLANPGIDNPVLATATVGTTTGVVVNTMSTVVPAQQIHSSNPVVFISATDFDINSAEISGYSNKIFTHVGYTWTDHEKWNPYVGGGISAEFGCHKGSGCSSDCASSSPVTTNNCSSGGSHNKFALSQWGIWVKGGVSFH